MVPARVLAGSHGTPSLNPRAPARGPALPPSSLTSADVRSTHVASSSSSLGTLGKDGKRDRALEHSCQQPAPVADAAANKIIFLSSMDNWYQRAITSTDDGVTWTPWPLATDLDASLRMPGWGLVFNGLPGGVQLTAPSPHAGRLVVCSSAYWSGGEMKDGKIVKAGDVASRYSFSIISDDHGATWRIGSKQVQPYHTTECSVAQSYHGRGELYMYTRIWAHKAGEARRGIAKSTDGGETWDTATLRGLGDTAPDCEGSMVSAVIKNETCFFVSAPYSAGRNNLTVQASCSVGGVVGGGGAGGAEDWEWSAGTAVFPTAGDKQGQSYSALGWANNTLHDLYMVAGQGVAMSQVGLSGLVP